MNVILNEIISNEFTFERFERKNVPNSPMTILKYIVKSISRTNIRADIEVKLNRSISLLFIHFTSYYQFSNNEYRNFFLDVWEDVCATLEGINGNILYNRIYSKLRDYTKLNHMS